MQVSLSWMLDLDKQEHRLAVIGRMYELRAWIQLFRGFALVIGG